ncbi:MAG: copper resistance protein NlpE N-terminal domain-containing protein [Accumulibacter sp.]|uniref:copper resistance protein NlpE N-terminal domain-containing protein n=1 Tax=Accumulibacter sp. TaxID=2053492 RepID=UPI0033145889
MLTPRGVAHKYAELSGETDASVRCRALAASRARRLGGTEIIRGRLAQGGSGCGTDCTCSRLAVLTSGAPYQVDLVLEKVRTARPAITGVSANPTTQPATSLGVELPATFFEVVPYADCRGVAQTLTLRTDGLYRLRRTYLSKSEGSFTELGR